MVRLMWLSVLCPCRHPCEIASQIEFVMCVVLRRALFVTAVEVFIFLRMKNSEWQWLRGVKARCIEFSKVTECVAQRPWIGEGCARPLA